MTKATGKKPRGTPAERFWRFVDKSAGEEQCWPWLGAKHKENSSIYYGRFLWTARKVVNAHRAAYMLAYGAIPDGLFVCHRCDVTQCVNPAHLFLGTASDNNRDCIEKGRARPQKGEEHSYAKLTADKVRDIVNRLHAGERQSSLAMMFGVHPSTISRIRSGQKWRVVTGGVVA